MPTFRLRSYHWLLVWAVVAPVLAALPAWFVYHFGMADLEADRLLGLRLHHSADEEPQALALFLFLGVLLVLYVCAAFSFLIRRRGVPRNQAGGKIVFCSMAAGPLLLVLWLVSALIVIEVIGFLSHRA
jgi:hypothetical protein